MLLNCFSLSSALQKRIFLLPTLLAGLILSGALRAEASAVPAAAEPKAAAELVLSVEPTHVVLVKDGTVKLTIASALAKLKPADVRLFCSVGHFDEAVTDDMGQLVVTYHLPQKLYPQVALLAAVAKVDQQTQLGWLSIPLFGRGEMTLEGRRRQKLSIRIGKQVFGPVRANRKGQADVKIEVPPGYEYGYVKKKKIPLGVVPFARLLLVEQRESITAGADAAASSTRLHLFAVDQRGQPLQKAEFDLQSSQGSLSPPQMRAPGHYIFSLSGIGSADTKKVTVSAQLKDDADFSSEVSLEVIAPAPVVTVAKVVEKPVPATMDWSSYVAAGGAGVLALAGVGALALESTLSLTALGNADDRALMQGGERAMLGLAAAGLLTGAVGGGMYLMQSGDQ